MQQLFIQLTLRQEQDEYLAEGIDWIPVKYDDNKEICDMIEDKPFGITALLDEERLLAKSNDLSFLAKINAQWAHQRYYFSHKSSDTQTQKTMARDVSYETRVSECAAAIFVLIFFYDVFYLNFLFFIFVRISFLRWFF